MEPIEPRHLVADTATGVHPKAAVYLCAEAIRAYQVRELVTWCKTSGQHAKLFFLPIRGGIKILVGGVYTIVFEFEMASHCNLLLEICGSMDAERYGDLIYSDPEQKRQKRCPPPASSSIDLSRLRGATIQSSSFTAALTRKPRCDLRGELATFQTCKQLDILKS